MFQFQIVDIVANIFFITYLNLADFFSNFSF